MALLERLAEAAKRQHDEADLPVWLLAEILEIAAITERHQESRESIELLLRQVEAFDSYAGTGCFGESASAADIEATLKGLRARG